MKLLILTFAAVFTEIALCVFTLMKFELWLVMVILAAYHAGYFLNRKNAAKFAAVPGFILLTAGLFLENAALLALGAFGMNSGMQSARTALKHVSRSGPMLKSIVKYGAMVMVSVTALIGILDYSLAVACMAAVFLIFITKERAAQGKFSAGSQKLLWAELLHHAHYFLYCYVLWAKFENNVYPYIGVLFVAGWIGYGLMEVIAKRIEARHGLMMLAGGHVLCALTILVMAFTNSLPFVTTLWGLTGLFGGSCYFLGQLSFSSRRENYENAGHLAGCVLSALICMAFGVNAAIMAAAAACTATAVFALYSRTA